MAANTVREDQRKRTLEALQRRFAVAEAELVQQNKKSNRLIDEEDGTKAGPANSSSVSSAANLAAVSVKTQPRKGNFSFSGHAISQDADNDGPAYSKLANHVHENLLTTNVQISGRKESKVDKILHELLQNGDSAQKYLQGSRSKKIDNWILLDNYVQGRGVSTGSRIRALRMHSKRSKKHMSMKQHKRNGVFDLPPEHHKFEKFRPMHEMWKGYMSQLLKNAGKNQLAQCLLDADLHGATILVAECKITSFTGVSGIMIRETAETLGIITQVNKFRAISNACTCYASFDLLFRKRVLSLYSRLIAGRLHYRETNSLQEIWACDLHSGHYVSAPEAHQANCQSAGCAQIGNSLLPSGFLAYFF
ncbi:hypothetical protein FNV43_RR24998 [Rhamnella rubrinervis]|uniref:Uncharacterized protein n=1 Tax=Rhamnella rubrinervis TaxID=2594499 RepID=A0A8K0DMU5_9ROSA|nr:hypothetical protein FNV43_RR24998 [Rhamnella rubrinervis]